MIEALVSDPEKLGLVAALLVAVTALVRGTVIPGSTHDRIVADLKERHTQEIALWKQIAFRGVRLSEESLSSLELAAKQQKSPRMER